MAGTAVYQDSAENLKALQHGFDGTATRVIRLDANGYQYVATDAGQSISVTSTDFDIRNLSNTQDNIVVYGNDGTSNQVIKTDNAGRTIVTNDTGETIAVSSTDLDIRNLSNEQDNLAIYGNDGSTNRAIKTDSEGVVQVTSSRTFTNVSQSVSTTDTYAGSTSQDISLQSSSVFFVNNAGANPANIKVQISPDNTLWVDDSSESTITASAVTALGITKFANYARIAYKSENSGQSTDLTIIYQAQT